jgi:hypothetical protein
MWLPGGAAIRTVLEKWHIQHTTMPTRKIFLKNLYSVLAIVVLDYDDVNAPGLRILNQPLYGGTLKICPAVSIVAIRFDLVPTLFLDVLLQQELLIFDADRFAHPRIPL